jgi:hypothetical protein
MKLAWGILGVYNNGDSIMPEPNQNQPNHPADLEPLSEIDFDELNSGNFLPPTDETRGELTKCVDNLSFSGTRMRMTSHEYDEAETPVRVDVEQFINDEGDITKSRLIIVFITGEGFDDRFTVYPGSDPLSEEKQRLADTTIDTYVGGLTGKRSTWLRQAYDSAKLKDKNLTGDATTGLLLDPPSERLESTVEGARVWINPEEHLYVSRQSGNEAAMHELRKDQNFRPLAISVRHEDIDYTYYIDAKGEHLLIDRPGVSEGAPHEDHPEIFEGSYDKVFEQGRDVPTEGTMSELVAAIKAVLAQRPAESAELGEV